MKNLNLLVPQDRPQSDRWEWATVTTASPLAVRLDGDSAPLSIVPECLFASPKVGQRVMVQFRGRQVIVHAPSGGVPAPVIPTPAVYRGHVSATQYIPYNTASPITLDATDAIDTTTYSNANGTVTLKVAGTYLVSSAVQSTYNVQISSSIYYEIQRNGAHVARYRMPYVSGYGHSASGSQTIVASANDTVRLAAFQNYTTSTTAFNISDGANITTYMTITRLG